MWTWYQKWPSLRWSSLLFLSGWLFISSLLYQAYLFAYDGQYQIRQMYEVLDVHQNPVAKLNVSYPAQVQFSETLTKNPVLVWLEPLSSITAPLTSTFIVSFPAFDEDIIFFNDKGLPTKPQIELTRENQRTSLIYLQLQPQTNNTATTASIMVTIGNLENPDIFDQNAMLLTPAIESRQTAFWWHIGELLFGPAAALLAGVAFLANLGLQQLLEYEKTRREKEYQKEIKLSQVKYLRVLVEQDITLAVQHWYDYNQKAQQDLEWRASEIKGELEEIWQIINSHSWQRAMLKKAVDYFEQEELNAVKEVVDLFRNLSTGLPKTISDSNKLGLIKFRFSALFSNKNIISKSKETVPSLNQVSVETIAARFLRAYFDQQRIVAEIEEIGIESTIKSLLWLHQEFGESIIPVVILPLIKLIENPKSIQAVDELLASTLNGQRLLREPKSDEALDNLIANKNTPQEAREIAQRLSEQRRQVHHWPELWPVLRPTEAPQLTNWLQQAELDYNPFGPEQAELDSYLPYHRIYPSLFETSLRGARPVIVFGAPGSGRTTSALLLVFDCADPPANPREQGAFPVYLKLIPDISANMTRVAYLELFVRAISSALINFFALNPFAFLEQSPANKSALAYLLICDVGSTRNLSLRLAQAGLPQESVGRRLIAEIAEKGKIGPKLVPPDEQTWLELLQKARPVEFSYTYLLIDVTDDEVTQDDVVSLSQQLQSLIRLILPLTSVGVYVKLFVPEIFYQHLTIPPDITVDKLTWSPSELKALLQARLGKAGNYQDLSQLFDTQSTSPNPTDQLIAAANGSPQLLIRLGNQLLKAHLRQTPDISQLSHQDLENILGTKNLL